MTPPPLPVDQQVEDVRIGQKLLIYAILLYVINTAFVIIAAGSSLESSEPAPVSTIAIMIFALGSIIAKVLGIWGNLRVTAGLGYTGVARFFLCLLMFVSCASFIVMIVLSSSATTFLRDRGLQVGLLGADKPRA